MEAEKPCVYVGLTGLTPGERFANHRAHVKGGRYAGSHGRRLLPLLYERFNPMPFRDRVTFVEVGAPCPVRADWELHSPPHR